MTPTDDEKAAYDYSVGFHESTVAEAAFLAGISHHEKKASGLVEALEEIADKTCSKAEFTRSALNLIATDALKNYRGVKE